MDALAPFRIPLASLKADEATYHWEVGPDFFRHFTGQDISEHGMFEVTLLLKRSGSVITLEFNTSGSVDTVCDRCTASISLPVSGKYEILVKIGDPAESTDEVIFIDPESHGLNVGNHIYDFILLSIPISRRIPGCEQQENPPCDMTVLAFLKENKIEDGPADHDSLWEDLRKVTDN